MKCSQLYRSWLDFSPSENTATIFPDQVGIIDNGGFTPATKHYHVTGRALSWQLNYPALSFSMNGRNFQFDGASGGVRDSLGKGSGLAEETC